MGRLVAIQQLRGLAVLSVVVFHALQWQWIPFEPGQAGVELFFVISGFVMWRSTAGREQTPAAFLARRAGRVVPLYWLATFTALTVVVIWPHGIPNVVPSLSHVLLSLAFIPHLDPKGEPFPLLNPGWTLNYEAMFYLVFAACLSVSKRRRAWAVTAGLVGVFLFGALIAKPTYYFGANAEMLVFLSGVWLSKAWDARSLPGPGVGLLLIAAGLAVLSVLTVQLYRPGLFRPLLFGGAALLTAIGWLSLAADRQGVPAWPWLEKVGDASYSIYLVHTLMSPLVAKAFLDEPWIFIPLDIVVGVSAGFACHFLIEKPLDRWVKGLLKTDRKAQEVNSRAGAPAAS